MQRTSLIAGGATGIIALVIGAAVGYASKPTADPTKSSQFATLQSSANSLQALTDQQAQSLATANAELTRDRALIGNLPQRLAAVSAAEAKAATDRAAAASDRAQAQAALGQTKSNTLSGDGVYQAGTDMDPGTYHTTGASGCYWEVSSDPNGSNIIANGNPDGPAFASLGAGQYLTVARCADWVKEP